MSTISNHYQIANLKKCFFIFHLYYNNIIRLARQQLFALSSILFSVSLIATARSRLLPLCKFPLSNSRLLSVSIFLAIHFLSYSNLNLTSTFIFSIGTCRWFAKLCPLHSSAVKNQSACPLLCTISKK